MAGFRLRGFGLALLAAAGLVVSLPAVANASFPGRNGRIAYIHQFGPDGNQWNIESVLPNGRGRRTLVARLGGFLGGPAYSPHGKKLVFSSPIGGSSLYLVRADGRGRRRRLTCPGPDESDRGPAWAPEGRRIAYIRSYLGAIGIRIYRARKSRRIDHEASELAWSVRGQIAIEYDPGGSAASSPSIYVMRPDGSDIEPVVDGEDPDWSPNGRWIVYRTAGWPGGLGAPRRPPGFTQDIAMIRRDGSDSRVLTTDGSDPAFSPDGKYIVFSRRNTLVVMRLRDHHLRTIRSGRLYAPTWQPLPRRR